MTDVAHILGEFIAAWNAGQRPRLDAYLDRVPAEDQDELADQIQTFLMIAPEPDYDEKSWAEMSSHPSVAHVAAASMEPEPWPSLLPRLRARVGLTIAQVVENLKVSGDRAKAERLLAQMESGELDPRRPSRTLLERLGRILGVSAQTLD